MLGMTVRFPRRVAAEMGLEASAPGRVRMLLGLRRKLLKWRHCWAPL